MARETGWRWVTTHPSAVLLAVQVLGVLVYPWTEEKTFGRVTFETLGIVILALVVLSVRSSPGPTWLVFALGAVAAGLSIADAVHPASWLVVSSAITHALVYFIAAGSLISYVLHDWSVTSDELFAVGATFTLVAWAFAYVFTVLQALQPGCFIAAVNPDAPRTWVELLFLSFTTLTSTGLSDVIPVTAVSRSVLMIEQLAGLGYVALFVSYVVALTITRRAGRDR